MLNGMAEQPNPLHPSVEGKGYTMLASVLISLGLVIWLIPLLWWLNIGGSAVMQYVGGAEEGRTYWHMLWGLPLVVVSYLAVRIVAFFIAGYAAGLRRVPLRHRWYTAYLPGLGAAALYSVWVPTSERPARSNYWTMFAFGTGFTINTALLAVALAAVFWREIDARELLLIYAGFCALLSGAALMPGKPEDPPSDSDMLQRLAHDGPHAQRYDALGRLAVQAVAGKMPEEWDTSLVLRVMTPRDGSILNLQALLVAYMHYAELQEFARADEILNEAMELSLRHNRKARAFVMLEGAYAQAHRGEVARARQIMQQTDAPSAPAAGLKLLDVALAIREGRRADFDTGIAALKAMKQNAYVAREIKQLEERAEEAFNE